MNSPSECRDSLGTGVRQGDALTVLRTLPSESVYCCVTLSVNPVMHSALVRFEGPQFQEERLHLAHGVQGTDREFTGPREKGILQVG